jgi:hypothetical protein
MISILVRVYADDSEKSGEISRYIIYGGIVIE